MSRKKEQEVLDRIAKTCSGLVYISETDSEVEAVSGNRTTALDEAVLRSSFHLAKGLPIESADPEDFFERLTREREWHSERDRQNAAGFARLKAVLEDELDELQIFRVGEVRVEIYVVGLDRNGRIAGVRMHAVET